MACPGPNQRNQNLRPRRSPASHGTLAGNGPSRARNEELHMTNRAMGRRAMAAARAAALAGLVGAGAARAQCDWFVQHVPDFDQRRQNTSTVLGLPGDGSMYCVPTSTLNWCAYIANH